MKQITLTGAEHFAIFFRRKARISRTALLSVALAGVFAVLYSLVSLVNHYNFRTHAHDLGLYNHAIYNYGRLRLLPTATLHAIKQPKFADHFDPSNILLGPSTWFFGSYSLLVVQIVFVLAGGFGVAAFVRRRFGGDQTALALFGQALFYTMWGVFSALSFDFHPVVLGAVMLPWLFWAFEARKWGWAWALFLLILGFKEGLGVTLAFTAVGLAWLYRRERGAVLHAGIMAVFATVYFITVLKVIIPALQPPGGAGYGYVGSFGTFGQSFSEIIETILKHPYTAFTYLFENQPGVEGPVGIKSEVYFFLMLSGGWALLARPVFFWMLLPVFAQKMYYNHFTRWSTDYHYSIEFVPMVVLAMVVVLGSQPWKSWQGRLARWAVWVLAAFITLGSFSEKANPWFSRTDADPLLAAHYKTASGVDRELVQTGLKLIPQTAVVSASNTVAPHLAFRRTIYLFPEVQEAAYIVLLDDGNPYPLTRESFPAKLSDLKADSNFTQRYAAGGLYIFQRRGY